MGKGVTLVSGTIVVLTLDGTLAYVEDVQPTYAAVVALPEQLPAHETTAVFTPGRVGAKKISPFSSADREVAVTELSDRNRDFIGTYEQLRKQHGPNYVQRTVAELAAVQQAAAPVHATRAPRGSMTPADKAARRAARRSSKIPCVKCGELPVHVTHQNGICEYIAPEKRGRGRVASDAPKVGTSEPKAGKTYRVVNEDLSALQATNDKFARGNRFFRVFLALKGLPDSTGTLAQVIAALAQDAGKPMTNPEKVTRRALKGLTDAGNVQVV